mgnify:CR=1 FL=1
MWERAISEPGRVLTQEGLPPPVGGMGLLRCGTYAHGIDVLAHGQQPNLALTH